MAKNRAKQKKADSLYTTRKDLILKTDHPGYIRDLIRIASGLSIDLSYLDLSGMIAHKMIFYYQNVDKSDLSFGSYQHSRFGRSSFMGANCEYSDFSGCSFKLAVFSGSKMMGADLSDCEMQNAFFFNVDLSGSDLRNSNLYRCNFAGSDLTNFDLRGANLDEAVFDGCNMDFLKINSRQKVNIFNLN
jgi:uncharacterized protein YjbI with pentapeptide repeats